MKSKAWTENSCRGILDSRLYFRTGGSSHLYLLFANGVPAIREIGFVKFITGEMWRPNNNLFGIFPMIIEVYVTAGAIMFGVPIGILTSVFMANVLPETDIQTAESSNRASWQEFLPLSTDSSD